MKIILLKKSGKKFKEFKKHEWELIHPEHFGEKLDRGYWTYKNVNIKAEENGKILGGLNGHYMAGVLYIAELIIAHDKRGTGVGKELISQVEKLARDNNVHLIYLETGKNWKAVKFYEKLGYKKKTLIKKFYSKKDFWLMTKYL